MSGMTGASMLRTRRKDVNVKPNRKLDRKSSRGMLYENEELRLRTININAEVERGQSDIKKLKRENEQLKREISALRYEYDRLDTMLRERRSSPEHSDDSASVCSACPECASADGSTRAVAFHDLSVVPEEGEQEPTKSGVESPCTCDDCQREAMELNDSKPPIIIMPQKENNAQHPNTAHNGIERTVDVLVHDTPTVTPRFFESVTSPPYHSPPPPPGFVVAPYQAPRFHTGGNVEDLLGEVQSSPTIQTTFIQQNSVFMCNTRRIMQRQCCCQKREPNRPPPVQRTEEIEQPKSYVTEKNIELTYDYPKSTPVPSSPSPRSGDELQTTTTEVASTVVFVERRIPIKPKRFDFFFRSRSAPVGENEEPIYATVNKLPKRLRRMELANLEKEVAYKTGEPDSSIRTDMTLKTDSESQVPPPDDDTSRSEREKSTIPKRPDSPKAKKRKRFSLTFKKRERKRREKKKDAKNGTAKNGMPVQLESDNERLIEEVQELGKHKHCSRHRPRNTMSSSSSGPRYKRDSYQANDSFLPDVKWKKSPNMKAAGATEWAALAISTQPAHKMLLDASFERLYIVRRRKYVRWEGIQFLEEMTTSHSEHERTNSVCSSINSLGSACTHKSRKLSAPINDGSIPWCGCWGAGCV